MVARRMLIGTVLAGLVLGAAGPSGASRDYTPAKKRCKTVVKRIHGKKKRVRVCRKVKPRAKVINARVQLDPARATSLTLTSSGGTTAVSAASGAKLTLTVPAGAARATSVRITPLRSIRGFPIRKLVAAVQLEPDGLQLDKPATLTIAPARGLPRRLIAFGYTGNGRAVHPYPFVRTGGTVTLPIAHFSGYGVGVPRDGGRAAFVATLIAELAATRAALSQAVANPASLGAALFRYSTWRAAALSFGELAGYVTDLRAFVEEVLERIRSRCIAGHDVQAALTALRGLDAALQLGLQELQPSRDRLQRCLRFELDFDTLIQGSIVDTSPNNEGGGQFTIHVRVPGLALTPTGPTGGAPFSKQIDYATWEMNWSIVDTYGFRCWLASNGVRLGEPFTVTRFLLDESSLSIDLSPGKPTEILRGACGEETPTDEPTHYYNGDGMGIFRFLHLGEVAGSGFRITGWNVLEGSVYARKTYEQTKVAATPGIQTETLTERTTLVLRHTPQT